MHVFCRRLCTEISVFAKDYFVTECGSWLLIAQRPVLERQGWWEGKSAYFGGLQLEGGWTPAQRPAPTGRGRALKGDFRVRRPREGPHAEWKHSGPDGRLHKLVISGLISVVLAVLRTVSLRFQVHLCFISLNPVLGLWQLYVVAAVGSSYS